MKKISYILILIFGGLLFHSCEDDKDVYQIDQDQTIAVFDSYRFGLGGLADGSEYDKEILVKITGAGLEGLTGDVTLTFAADESSTAIEGTHYRIENKTITLTQKNYYMGIVDFVLVTEGNTPPLDDDPAFADYQAPVLNLKITNATGGVTPTGKLAEITLNFTPPNPYAGLYECDINYFHPTAGGTYPDDPYAHDVFDKTLTAVTGRKCESLFGIESWASSYADKCWITVNADNSITYTVADTWGYDVKLGDPNDATKVSYFDPDTGVIYLYYHYVGDGGARIFWEVLTPKFK